MTDLLPVSDLEAPQRPPAARAVPLLWVVVGALLIASVLAAVVHEPPATPEERVAAAATAVRQDDFAFEATFEGAGPIATFDFLGGVDVGTSRLTGAMTIQGAEIEVVQDGLVQYVHLPEALLPAGQKPWLKMDLSKLGLPATVNPGTAMANPLDTLRELDAIVGGVDRVGEEQVRGVDTVHFRFVVDTLKAQPDAAKLLKPDQLERLRRVPVDLWLDDANRPRRVRQALDAGGAVGRFTTNVELFDFGKDVTITLPPEDQVQELDLTNPGSLFGGGGLGAPAAPAD